jgi:hypothetical protein
MKLNPDETEDAEYITNDAGSFEHQRSVVEDKTLAAHRMAGADPVGLTDNGVQGESGRAKSLRFSASEERVLARFSQQTQKFHKAILEIAARRFSPDVPGIDEKAFLGSVRYQSKFDLADADDLIDQYASFGADIQSPTYHTFMQTRIAHLTMGDVSKELRDKVEKEIKGVDAEPPKTQRSDVKTDESVDMSLEGSNK